MDDEPSVCCACWPRRYCCFCCVACWIWHAWATGRLAPRSLRSESEGARLAAAAVAAS